MIAGMLTEGMSIPVMIRASLSTERYSRKTLISRTLCHYQQKD